MAERLLEVEGLATHFSAPGGALKAVDGVSLRVDAGEVLGLVGESGCGKTVLSLSIVGLVEPPSAVVAGSVRFAGMELVGAPEKVLNTVRGRRIAMIFQQPHASLDPVMSVGAQIGQALRHGPAGRLSRDARKKRVIELLAQVGIPDPRRRARQHPHQMSGGMAQRVMIAIALAAEPDLLIADEPTTALDVTVQAQILELLREVQSQRHMGIILITHDLSVVAELADRVAVMYAGRIVENSPIGEIYRNPLHPYTRGLMDSRATSGAAGPAAATKRRLQVIPGRVPTPVNLPPGCAFAARCGVRTQSGLTQCTAVAPPATKVGSDRLVYCWAHEQP